MTIDIDEKELAVLQKAYEIEQEKLKTGEYYLGWHWDEVQAYVATINKLIVKGLVVISFKSNSDKTYKLTESGMAAAQGDPVEESEPEEPQPIMENISIDTMFSDIVGYDDVKELIFESLQAPDPIHIMLVGPPALAKSMFLWDVERVYGSITLPLIGSGTSHAGLWDLLAERKPRIVLMDELQRMQVADQAALLALLEGGRLIRAKKGRMLDEKFTVWMLAAANRIDKMSPELISRFALKYLKEYNSAEFNQVVKNVLMNKEKLSEFDATATAIGLFGKTHDVRTAIRVARLSKRVGVKRAIELLIQ